MQKLKTLCCALALSTAVSANGKNPSAVNSAHLPAFVQHPEDIVTSGWKLIATKGGDLDGDTTPDVAVLMRMTRKTDIKRLPASSHYFFDDTNPYLLVIGLARANGYALLHSNVDLFPREVAPMHGDEPPDARSMDIHRGVLTLNFYHLRGFDRLRFRWDGKTFGLIGYDCSGVGAGEVTSLSANYLTRTAKYTRGPISGGHDIVTVVKLDPAKLPSLEQFDWESDWTGKDVRGRQVGC